MGGKQSKQKKKQFKLNMNVAEKVPTFLALVSEVIQNPPLFSDPAYIDDVIYHYCKFMIAVAEDAPTRITSDVMWMWHLHQLHAFDYSNACGKAFGQIIAVIQGGEEDYEGTQYSLSDFKYLLDLKALALKQHKFLEQCAPFCSDRMIGDMALYKSWERDFEHYINMADYNAEVSIGVDIIWRTYLHYTRKFNSNKSADGVLLAYDHKDDIF